jgi:hypothetical protein
LHDRECRAVYHHASLARTCALQGPPPALVFKLVGVSDVPSVSPAR